MVSPRSLVETVRQNLEDAPREVLAVYLYGSRARGTSAPGSDVDLAVLLRDEAPTGLKSAVSRIEDDVERAVRLPVEAIALNTASADLTHRVLRDGILLLDRGREARIRFEVRARNEYFDLAPIRRLYRRVPA